MGCHAHFLSQNDNPLNRLTGYLSKVRWPASDTQKPATGTHSKVAALWHVAQLKAAGLHEGGVDTQWASESVDAAENGWKKKMDTHAHTTPQNKTKKLTWHTPALSV